MKIKTKLTLIFTVIVAVILCCLNAYIYILSYSFTRNNFYNELKDRVNVTATVFLEADEQSNVVIDAFRKKYLQSLPQEILRVYNDKNESQYVEAVGRFDFDPSLIKKIRKKKEFHSSVGMRQTVGIYYEDNQGNFVIIASAIDEVGIRNLNVLKFVLIFGFFISIVVLFFAGRFFTKLILKPVSSITEHTNQITETNLHLRLDEGNKKDELAELSIVINRMLARLENAFDLQKSFVANASHELRNPLTSIIGNIEVTLSKTRTEEEHKQVLESIMEEAEKLHKLINGLLNLAQSNIDFEDLHKEEIRLDELLFELKDEMKIKRPENKIAVILPQLPENPLALTIRGDRSLIETALINLIDNACKFSGNGNVVVSLLLLPEFIQIKIEDSGIGIDQNDLPHLTETFYRAGNARSFPGTGIGLTLAEKIISLHKGKLEISSELNKGTTVSVFFAKS